MGFSGGWHDSLVTRRRRFIRVMRVVLGLWALIAAGGATRVAWAVAHNETWIGAANVPLTDAEMWTGFTIFAVMAGMAVGLLALMLRWAKSVTS
jgi:hypothetical protein